MSQHTEGTPARPTRADERRVLTAFRSAYARAQDGDRLEIRFAGGTIQFRRRRPVSRDSAPVQGRSGDASERAPSDALMHWQDDGGPPADRLLSAERGKGIR